MGMERRAERKDEEDTMTAAKAMKPNGGADDCLATERSASNANLMQQALTRENLQRAWEQVRANHGAPGIDGMTVEQFPDFVRSPQWASVRKALEDGTYRASAGPTGVYPEGQRRPTASGHSDGARPRDTAGAGAGAGTVV